MVNTEVKYVFHGTFLVLIFLLLLGGALKLYMINFHPDNSSSGTIPVIEHNEVKSETHSIGKKLFLANCAACHHPEKIIIGPALNGVQSRITDKILLHQWVHNSSKVLAGGNTYFVALFQQFNKTPMNNFPELTDAEIDSIIQYADAGSGGHRLKSTAK